MASVADPVPLTPARFKVLRPLARGGFSAVFLARDEELNRVVVVKAMRGKYANRRWARDQLLFEAEVTAGLEHPGVVPVYSRGIDGAGRAYFTMRFVKGEPLGAAIKGLHRTAEPAVRRKVLRRLVDRLVDVCYTLDFAHRRGVTHRDVTPANVMFGEHGETLLLDWGLARLVTPAASPAGGPDAPAAPLESCEVWPKSARERGKGGTEMGVSLGTPRYMSPEQAEGDWDRFGPASDVFSLGATLYELLTGRAPFDDDDRDKSEELAKRGAFAPPREVDRRVPAALDTVCLKAMMREPSERYADAVALGSDLARWASGEPVSVPRASTVRDWKAQLHS